MTTKKRDAGDGSVNKRKDGRWQGSIRGTDATGKAHRFYVYGKTEADVKTALKKARRRVEDGQTALDTSSTFDTYATQWVDGHLAASERKQTTKEWYQSLLQTHVLPAIGGYRLDKLKPLHIERMLADMRRAGKKASTVRGALTVTRSILATAVRDGLLRTSPAGAVDRPHLDTPEARVLEPSEVGRLMGAAAGHRLAPLLVLMVHAGLRRGEALALTWDAVDLDSGRVTVRASLARVKAGLIVQTPKTRQTRWWTVSGVVVEALKAHRAAQHAERLRAGSAWTDNGLVFATEVGTYLEPRNVARWFDGVARRAEVDGATLHTLRHTSASLAFAGGVHPVTVSKMLGHSTPAVTLAIYAHVLDDSRRDASEAIARRLSGVMTGA